MPANQQYNCKFPLGRNNPSLLEIPTELHLHLSQVFFYNALPKYLFLRYLSSEIIGLTSPTISFYCKPVEDKNLMTNLSGPELA